jgi:hypothetical protein
MIKIFGGLQQADSSLTKCLFHRDYVTIKNNQITANNVAKAQLSLDNCRGFFLTTCTIKPVLHFHMMKIFGG